MRRPCACLALGIALWARPACLLPSRPPQCSRNDTTQSLQGRVSYRVNAQLWRVRGHAFMTRCACRALSTCCSGPCRFTHTCRHARSRFLPSIADVPNWPVTPGEPGGAYHARMRTRCAFLALGWGFAHPKAAPAIARIAHSSLEPAQTLGATAVVPVPVPVPRAREESEFYPNLFKRLMKTASAVGRIYMCLSFIIYQLL